MLNRSFQKTRQMDDFSFLNLNINLCAGLLVMLDIKKQNRF